MKQATVLWAFLFAIMIGSFSCVSITCYKETFGKRSLKRCRKNFNDNTSCYASEIGYARLDTSLTAPCETDADCQKYTKCNGPADLKN